MADFSDVATKLRENAGSAWSQEVAESLLSQLKSSGDARADELRECTEASAGELDNMGYDSATDCIQDRADFGPAYQNAWDNNPGAAQAIGAAFSAAWDQQARNQARQLAENANIDELNQMCMDGNYGQVENMTGTNVPDNAAGCMDAVADAQGISGENGSYASAWQ